MSDPEEANAFRRWERDKSEAYRRGCLFLLIYFALVIVVTTIVVLYFLGK